MPRKTPLPQSELMVGKRLDKLRQERRLSRSDLAYFARVDEASITRAELGLAPLNYEVARRILRYLEVNPFWMATGEGPVNLSIDLPESYEIGAQRGAGFLEVFEALLRPILARQFGPQAPGAAFSAEELAGLLSEPLERVLAFKTLALMISSILASMDRSQIQEFREKLRQFIRDYPEQPARNWAFRLKGNADLAGASGEMEAHFRWLQSGRVSLVEEQTGMPALRASDAGAKAEAESAAEQARGNSCTNTLTSESSECKKAPDMNISIGSWAELRDRLRALTVERGAQAALARTFGVTPGAVSEWLREKSSPSADMTIRLLPWVVSEETRRRRESGLAKPKPSKSSKSKTGGKGKR